MVTRVRTVAFQGIEAQPVDVQVMIAPGKMGMHIVGLPDKAVAESRERVQAALHASGLSMPVKKVTVNLAPADLPKEGQPKAELRFCIRLKMLRYQRLRHSSHEYTRGAILNYCIKRRKSPSHW